MEVPSSANISLLDPYVDNDESSASTTEDGEVNSDQTSSDNSTRVIINGKSVSPSPSPASPSLNLSTTTTPEDTSRESKIQNLMDMLGTSDRQMVERALIKAHDDPELAAEELLSIL